MYRANSKDKARFPNRRYGQSMILGKTEGIEPRNKFKLCSRRREHLYNICTFLNNLAYIIFLRASKRKWVIYTSDGRDKAKLPNLQRKKDNE